jgi:hypothetical protein
MPSLRWPATHWGLFGLGLATGALLIDLVFWRLRHAYVADALTRSTLVDALVLSLAALVMLLLAGWAFADRPRTPARVETDPLWN